PINSTVISLTVGAFICPSEVRPEVSTHDYGRSGVINYGMCGGDWFVWGGFNGPYNRQAFGPNRSLRLASITDGVSQTLFAAEVKAYQTSSNCRFTTLPSVNNPNNIPSPYANPFQVAPEYDDGACMTENQYEFHTEWSDGHVHAGGFTTAWPPNKAIIGRPGSLFRGWTWTSMARMRRTAVRRSRRSTPAATTPAASTRCWAMAACGSSRARSTGWSGGPWGRSPAAKSSPEIVTDLGAGGGSMGCVIILATLPAQLGAGPQNPPTPGKPEEKISAPELGRTFPLEGVRGPADRTGISGRIDHMAYDPATRRLFIACVANGSLEVIDLEAGKRIGTIDKLPGPQG